MTAQAPFVGRTSELEILRGFLRDATEGAGVVAMLVGEAGIGKSRVARTFADPARASGALVAWGSCYEGDWAPAFGPWLEALGELAKSIEPDHLRQYAGDQGLHLSRMLPGVGSLPSDSSFAEPLGPSEERVRLFDSVGYFLRAVTIERPLVIILDDLHWGDPDLLQLLRYVARLSTTCRMLVLGTYRDPTGDLSEAKALADVLAIVRRESDYRRIALEGLSAVEVADHLTGLAGRDLPLALDRAIYAAAAGNPFYVEEIFRHLVEEKKIQLREGRWSTDISTGQLGIPDGVRQVVARRISRLAPSTARMLSVVAALTSGFEFRLLLALLDLSEESLLDSLDEGLRAGFIRIVDGDAVTYDFAHSIVRQTLLGGLNPDRRSRLHRHIAVVLEQTYAGIERAHASELAYQFHASASVGGGERGIAYCLQAADDARASYAFDRVVIFLRMARDLTKDRSTRVLILQRLATAQADALALADARQTVEEAIAAMKDANVETHEQSSFLAVVARALKDGGAGRELWQPLVENGLALVEAKRDLTWARLTLILDRFESERIGEIHVDRWIGHNPEAVAVARTVGDEIDYAHTLEPRLWHSLEETHAVARLAKTWQNPVAVMRALGVVANDLLTRHGAFREAADRLADLLASAQTSGSVSGQAEALVQLALVHADFGEFTLAQESADRADDVLRRLGPGHRLQSWIPWLRFCLAYYLDDTSDQEWEAIASEVTHRAGDSLPHGTALSVLSASTAAVAYARVGRIADVDHILDGLVGVFERLEPRTYAYGSSLVFGIDAAWTLFRSRHATRLRQFALDAIGSDVGDPPLGSLLLGVARASALLGDQNTALDFFGRARTSLAQSGRKPLQAIVSYDEARFLLRARGYNRQRVGALVNTAVSEFNDLKMSGWEQRARDLGVHVAPMQPGVSFQTSNPARLTPREVEVLQLIAMGKTTQEIAADIYVSPATVERHISNIYGKIGARGRADATAYAWQHGFASTR